MISATPGTLAAVSANPYDFVADDGNRKSGTSFKLFLVPVFEEGVLEVRCDQGHYEQARQLGAGAQVEVLVQINARNNRVVYTCKGLSLASANGKAKVGA